MDGGILIQRVSARIIRAKLTSDVEKVRFTTRPRFMACAAESGWVSRVVGGRRDFYPDQDAVLWRPVAGVIVALVADGCLGDLAGAAAVACQRGRSRADAARHARYSPGLVDYVRRGIFLPASCKARERGSHRDAQQTMDTVPDILFALDADLCLAKWNSAMEAATGLSGLEIAGRHALSFLDPEDHAVVQAAIEACFATGYAEEEARLLTRDGSRVLFQVRTPRCSRTRGPAVCSALPAAAATSPAPPAIRRRTERATR